MLSLSQTKMTTRRQKRKAVAELASANLETPITRDNQPENLVAGTSESPEIQPENLDEVKLSLRKRSCLT